MDWKGRLTENRIIYGFYPALGIGLILCLLYLSPFLWSVPSYLAFLICLYRLVRYDAKVFAVDYCAMIPMMQVFRTAGGMSLLLILALCALVWHVLRGGIRVDLRYVVLILFVNYLVARMQLDISRLGLCAGQLCVLCVILPKQNDRSVACAAKLFCFSLLLGSVYALAFRGTDQLQKILGQEVEAIWGTGILRFRGTMADPNYYMTMLIAGLVMLVKLWYCGWIKKITMFVLGAAFVMLGVLTYSKTFFLFLVLFALAYVIWQFYSKHYRYAIVLVSLGLVAGLWALLSDSSPLAVVLARFGSGGLRAITTGRSEVYLAYLREVFSSPTTALFGKGLAAKGLYKDPHNLYIEILYYIGIVGLLGYLSVFAALVGLLNRKDSRIRKQPFLSRYCSVILLAALFMTLHGMFQVALYADAFVMLMAVMIVTAPKAFRADRKLSQGKTELINDETDNGTGKTP